MHAAHARNSGQEFLELELYYDFSRCNPNSHEICMSQIARYTDDRINGRSFSSSISRFDAKARDPAGERDRLVTMPRFTPRSPFHRLDSVPCNEFPDRIIASLFCIFSSSYISAVDFVYAALSYPVFLPFRRAVSPRSMIYGRDNARDGRHLESIKRTAAARRRLEANR